MNDYPTSAKVYWFLTSLLGLAALGFAGQQIGGLATGALASAALGIGAAAIAGLFPILIPSTKTSVTVADIFVFALLIHFGPPAAIIAAAAEASAISIRTSKRWTSWLGSPAMAAIAMLGAGTLFDIVTSKLQLHAWSPFEAVLAAALLAAVAYFIVGTLLMSTLIKLKRGEAFDPVQALKEHYWIGVGYAMSASFAALIHADLRGRLWVVLAVVPVVAVFIHVLRVYLRHGALKIQCARDAHRA